MNVPVCPVPDCAYLQPKAVVFGDPVEIVEDTGLVGAPNVIEVVEEEVRIAVREFAQIDKTDVET